MISTSSRHISSRGSTPDISFLIPQGPATPPPTPATQHSECTPIQTSPAPRSPKSLKRKASSEITHTADIPGSNSHINEVAKAHEPKRHKIDPVSPSKSSHVNTSSSDLTNSEPTQAAQSSSPKDDDAPAPELEDLSLLIVSSTVTATMFTPSSRRRSTRLEAKATSKSITNVSSSLPPSPSPFSRAQRSSASATTSPLAPDDSREYAVQIPRAHEHRDVPTSAQATNTPTQQFEISGSNPILFDGTYDSTTTQKSHSHLDDNLLCAGIVQPSFSAPVPSPSPPLDYTIQTPTPHLEVRSPDKLLVASQMQPASTNILAGRNLTQAQAAPYESVFLPPILTLANDRSQKTKEQSKSKHRSKSRSQSRSGRKTHPNRDRDPASLPAAMERIIAQGADALMEVFLCGQMKAESRARVRVRALEREVAEVGGAFRESEGERRRRRRRGSIDTADEGGRMQVVEDAVIDIDNGDENEDMYLDTTAGPATPHRDEAPAPAPTPALAPAQAPAHAASPRANSPPPQSSQLQANIRTSPLRYPPPEPRSLPPPLPLPPPPHSRSRPPRNPPPPPINLHHEQELSALRSALLIRARNENWMYARIMTLQDALHVLHEEKSAWEAEREALGRVVRGLRAGVSGEEGVGEAGCVGVGEAGSVGKAGSVNIGVGAGVDKGENTIEGWCDVEKRMRYVGGSGSGSADCGRRGNRERPRDSGWDGKRRGDMDKEREQERHTERTPRRRDSASASNSGGWGRWADHNHNHNQNQNDKENERDKENKHEKDIGWGSEPPSQKDRDGGRNTNASASSIWGTGWGNGAEEDGVAGEAGGWGTGWN